MRFLMSLRWTSYVAPNPQGGVKNAKRSFSAISTCLDFWKKHLEVKLKLKTMMQYWTNLLFTQSVISLGNTVKVCKWRSTGQGHNFRIRQNGFIIFLIVYGILHLITTTTVIRVYSSQHRIRAHAIFLSKMWVALKRAGCCCCHSEQTCSLLGRRVLGNSLRDKRHCCWHRTR